MKSDKMSANYSNFLNQIGLGAFDLGYLLIGMAILAVLLLIFIVISVILLRKIGKMKKRLDQFLTG